MMEMSLEKLKIKMNQMTINELHIQFDLQPESKINILKNIARKCSKGYLFVDSSDGHCYLFDEDGNEDDVKKLTKIDGEMFYGSNIKSIIIPDSVKSIGNWAFWNCESLKSIVIPDSVENIGSIGFTYCKSLKSVEIPDSVKKIGYRAFDNCESLKSLTFKGKTIDQVKAMNYYPFGIENESIIRCC